MQVILLERIAAPRPDGRRRPRPRRLCPQLPPAAGQGAPRHQGQRASASRPTASSSRPATSSGRARPSAVAEKLDGKSFIVIRQAGETGQLYGSVNARDLADALTAGGFTVGRTQVVLNQPIKTIGLHTVVIALHPEVEVEGHDQRCPQRGRGDAPGPRREPDASATTAGTTSKSEAAEGEPEDGAEADLTARPRTPPDRRRRCRNRRRWLSHRHRW